MSQTLNEIKLLLAEAQVRPRRGMGQNFLHDANQMRRIIEAAKLVRDDVVLEVGAGTGTLTECLIEAGARVAAVEMDQRLCAIIRKRLGDDHDNVILVEADVMAGKHAINPLVNQALAQLCASKSEILNPKSEIPFKLVANLPYNIASPLLAVLATDWPGMTAGIVMVQREVADRLTAAPDGKDYGPIGVIVQVMCQVQRLFVLSPDCFWPKPKVESAVIRITRRDRPLTDDPHRFAALVHKLFHQRRKQIGTILGRDTPLPEGVQRTMRPEQLTVEQLVQLSESLPATRSNK